MRRPPIIGYIAVKGGLPMELDSRPFLPAGGVLCCGEHGTLFPRLIELRLAVDRTLTSLHALYDKAGWDKSDIPQASEYVEVRVRRAP